MLSLGNDTIFSIVKQTVLFKDELNKYEYEKNS